MITNSVAKAKCAQLPSIIQHCEKDLVLEIKRHLDLEPMEGPKRTDDVFRLSTEGLFGGRKEIEIEHQGAVYRLRITRQGKLILNK